MIIDTDLRRYYNNKECSDLLLEIDDYNIRTYHAHKVVLSAGSKYFRRVLERPEFNVRQPLQWCFYCVC